MISVTFLNYIIVYRFLKKYENIWTDKELLLDLYKNKKSLLNFFLVSFFFAIFMNIDVILTKNVFDEKIAWIYDWISILWKFLVYALLSVETVYYSQILENKKEELPKQFIKKSYNFNFFMNIMSFVC